MALEEIRGTRLEAIWRTPDRRPAFRVVIWNPRLSKVQDVALDRTVSPSYDVSSVVEQVQLRLNQVFENSDDAVSSQANLRIVYPDSGFIPLQEGGRLNFSERLFREGTAIRVYQGDARIAPEDWPAVFTGSIVGFPSADVADRNGTRRITIAAYGRAFAFQSQTIVGFSFGYGTDLGDAAVDLALDELRLEREEVRFGKFDYVTRHKANALTQISKIRGLYELMYPAGRKPYFDGYGRLVSHVTGFDRPPVWILDTSPIVLSLERVQNLRAVTNSVQVIGLNSELSKVVSPTTKLGEYSVTLGYFDTHHREVVFYSNDKRRRAEETYIEVIHKGDFGSSVEWEELNEFSGKITIDTGYAPWVVGAIITVWAILSITEYALDLYIGEAGVLGRLVDLGIAPVARFIVQVLKAATMLYLLQTMTKIGRFRIEIYGRPFEFVFEELRSIAYLANVPVADQNELEITNHWLSTAEDTDAKAREGLRRELAKSQPYRIRIASNGFLEVDDLIAIRAPEFGLDAFSIFYITGIQKTLDRSPAEDVDELVAWKVTERASLAAIR